MGADALAELDDGDKAIAGSAVPFLSAKLRRRTERSERAVDAAGEGHRNTGCAIAERMVDRARNALEAIDLAPRHRPPTKFPRQPRHGIFERLELLVGAGVSGEAH